MDQNHIMDRTNKIITIIGLVFEAISVVSLLIVTALWSTIEELYVLMETEMTEAEYEIMIRVMDFVGSIIYVFAIVLAVILVLNLFVFTKLVKGNFDEQTAKKVYLYQAVWGGINLLSNQVTGILYLVSGVRGYNGQYEETDIREGI